MNKKMLIVIGIIAILMVSFIFIKNRNIQNDNPSTPYVSPHGNLSEVKIATLYEKVTDRELAGGRSIEETIEILKATNTDMIFRGFWIWNFPPPESPDNIPPEIVDLVVEQLNIKPEQVPELIRRKGISYEELKTSITAIKKEMSETIFVGAIPAQTVGRVDMNPITGKVFNNEETWAMAFDPQKWNISYEYEGKKITKELFQELKATNNQENFSGDYDYRKAHGYFPDITNTDFQELFLSWAEKQIDSGADAIWIDLLYSQAKALEGMTKDINHPAVKESYEAATKLVDEIHKIGDSKGIYVYVGTWSEPIINYPYALPKLDFVTDSPSPEEIYYGKFDEEKWNRINAGIKSKFGNIPHFAFIDWGGKPDASIDVFSQRLNKEQQKEWLKQADEFFQSKGIVFIYPIHGGDFWGDTKVCSFGKFTKYDSLAPEFDTYETIKELANKRK